MSKYDDFMQMQKCISVTKEKGNKYPIMLKGYTKKSFCNKSNLLSTSYLLNNS